PRRSASAPNQRGSSLIVAGRMNTSARNATPIVSASSPPNHAVGLYSDISSTPYPQLLMIAVVSDARAHDGRDVQRDAEVTHHAEHGEHRQDVRQDRQQPEPRRSKDDEDDGED